MPISKREDFEKEKVMANMHSGKEAGTFIFISR